MSVMRDLPSPVQINITGFGAGWRERLWGGRRERAKELASLTAADGRNSCDCLNGSATVESEALGDIFWEANKNLESSVLGNCA